MSYSEGFDQFFDRISMRSVAVYRPIESSRTFFSPNPQGPSCDQDFNQISSSVSINSPTQASTEEFRACLAMMEGLSNTIKEVKDFQNTHPNLPGAQARALQWKLFRLEDELHRLRAIQDNQEHVSTLPSLRWRRLHGVEI